LKKDSGEVNDFHSKNIIPKYESNTADFTSRIGERMYPGAVTAYPVENSYPDG
jgi:hypothetical protein